MVCTVQLCLQHMSEVTSLSFPLLFRILVGFERTWLPDPWLWTCTQEQGIRVAPSASRCTQIQFCLSSPSSWRSCCGTFGGCNFARGILRNWICLGRNGIRHSRQAGHTLDTRMSQVWSQTHNFLLLTLSKPMVSLYQEYWGFFLAISHQFWEHSWVLDNFWWNTYWQFLG